MKRFVHVSGAVAVLTLGLAVASSAQQVSVTVRDGRVTIKAENASVRQILEEWARVGQTKVVNAEKVTGPPVTLTLIDQPEREALDTVLRTAAGYAVVEKATLTSNTSMFDRILVMGRTTPVTQVAAAASAPAPVVYTPPADVNDEPMVADANEPPQPTAPVVNPYGNGPAGANANMNGGVGVGGGAGMVTAQPEIKFDYTNPQAYFEQQRRAQAAAQGGQPGQATQQPVMMNPYPGSNANPVMTGQPQPQQPSNVPTAGTGTTLTQPGMAPPQPTPAPPAGRGGNFNPYNMNPYNMPQNANPGSAPPTTPVEPDRSKYANPYVPSQPRSTP